MADHHNQNQLLVLHNGHAGHVAIQPSYLTRLNYHDGMFLRAAELKQEQDYLRQLAALSNQAGGAGIVHGFDCTMQGGQLHVGPGLAIDPQGRVLRLPQSTSVGIDDLIARSRPAGAAGPPPEPVEGSAAFELCEVRSGDAPASFPGPDNLYVITVGYAEAACGESEIYGDPCQQACRGSTDYAYLVEGVILRATPFRTALRQPSFPNLTQIHLRSRLAAGYFDWEQQQTQGLISRAGLASPAWCLGAVESGGDDIPLALLSVGSAQFLDAWIVRRERMDSPPRRYWMQRMAMRPWSVFLAQILQFQCQLRHCFEPGAAEEGGEDPCRESKDKMSGAAGLMAELLPHYRAVSELLAQDPARFPGIDVPRFESSVKQLEELKTRLQTAQPAALAAGTLLNCGIVELPSAGYLPVFPERGISVNEQVRNLMGAGVDLRFCAVRADYVPHALEAAQHMERISLVQGLERPSDKPRVDVLVPGGEIRPVQSLPPGTGYDMTLKLFPPGFSMLVATTWEPTDEDKGKVLRDIIEAGVQAGEPRFVFRGAARGEQSAQGGAAFYFAGLQQPPLPQGPSFTLINLLRVPAIWIALESERDPFAIPLRESSHVNGEVLLLFVHDDPMLGTDLFRVKVRGDLQILSAQTSPMETRLSCRLTGTLEYGDPRSQNPAADAKLTSIAETVVLLRRGTDAERPTIEAMIPSPRLLGSDRKLVSWKTLRRWASSTSATVEGNLQPAQSIQPAAPSFTIIPQAQLYTAEQKVAPVVLTPSHPAHALSVAAIRAVAARLREPDFAELAVRRLFPPPREVTQDLVIDARESWVLFHRRREKQCAIEQPQPPAVAARRYRIYLVKLDQVQGVAELDAALKANDGAAILGFQPVPVTVAEFGAGIQSLQTSPDIVRADWQAQAGSAARIVYGAVASLGPALDEGQALASARLGTLAEVLSAVTRVDDAVKLESLPAVPDASALSAAPHDGIMVVATIPLPTVCHTIYRLDSSQRAILDRIEGTNADKIVDLLEKTGQAQLIGHAIFPLEATELIATNPDDLTAPWNASGNGDISNVVVISQRTDPPTPAEQINRFKVQAKEIALKVRPGAVLDVSHKHPQTLEKVGKCPAITVLVGEPKTRMVRNEVIVHSIADGASIDDLIREIQEGGLARVAPPTPNNSVGTVTFTLPDNKPDATSLDKFKAAWVQRIPPRNEQPKLLVAVSPKGTPAADQKTHADQATAINQVMAGVLNVKSVVSGDSDSMPFPSKCQAVTLAIFRIIG